MYDKNYAEFFSRRNNEAQKKWYVTYNTIPYEQEVHAMTVIVTSSCLGRIVR